MLKFNKVFHRWQVGTKQLLRTFSSGKNIKTGIVMLNMGGPSTPEETGPFLKRLFTDSDIINLGGGKFQAWAGDYYASKRTPRIAKQYEIIGGSPIRKWTEYQGVEMSKLLDVMSPETGPHKAYTCFRYADPLTEEALAKMKDDNVEHAIAFSQFPMWSCTTSGSSMNELVRRLNQMNLEKIFKWSIIDRWFMHDGFHQAVIERMNERLNEFEPSERENVTIVFSAHSEPMKNVEDGDSYVPEVCAAIHTIMNKFHAAHTKNKFIVGWQSKVGYLPWMVPNTSNIIKALGKTGTKNMLVVPIAFTSDHIETLFEIGHEYKEEAEEVGITNFQYTEGLNGSKTFIQALANIVKEHLDAKQNYNPAFSTQYLNPKKPDARTLLNPKYK